MPILLLLVIAEFPPMSMAGPGVELSYKAVGIMDMLDNHDFCLPNRFWRNIT